MLTLNAIAALILGFFFLVLILLGIKIVPQSEVYVIERFGRYVRTLSPGLSIIMPLVDRVAHKVVILERQLGDVEISVFTKDNVEVTLQTTVFFRILDAEKTVYRIRNIQSALQTATASIVRSAAGKLELDELQSSREAMNVEIAENLHSAAEVWGIEITRTEIIDVIVDDATKEAQRQQLNADRKRRATIAEAEGERRSVELAADAELYRAEKEAQAIKVTADAKAYMIKVEAEAEAKQTELLGKAIANKGQPAVNYDIMKRQVSAVADLASSPSTKTLVLPTEITSVIGAVHTLLESLPGAESPILPKPGAPKARKKSSRGTSLPSTSGG